MKTIGSVGCAVFLYWGGIALGVAADSLDTWKRISPGATASSLQQVIFGKGMFVAVGDAGTIVTSRDGLEWSLQSAGTSVQLRGIAFGDGQFVAVGEAGVIVTSGDGTTWVSAPSGTTRPLHAVTYGNGRFVACGGPVGAAILSSTDGLIWTLKEWGMSMDGVEAPLLTGITYGNGIFVAVFAGAHNTLPLPWVFVSADGLTWTIQRGPDGVSAIAFVNNQFVGVGGYNTLENRILMSHAVIYSSADGLNWTLRMNMAGAPGTLFSGVSVTDNQFL